MQHKTMEPRDIRPRRRFDAAIYWAASWLLGVVMTGSVSYITHRDEFVKSAITKQEVHGIISDLNAEYERELTTEISALKEVITADRTANDVQFDALRSQIEALQKEPRITYRIYRGDAMPAISKPSR